MSKLSPQSTTSTKSTDSSHTSCYESESDESDGNEDSGLKQDSGSSASTSRNQRNGELHPVMSMIDKDNYGEYQNQTRSPAVSHNSMQSERSMNCPIKFSQGPDVTGITAPSPAPTLASIQSMVQPAAFSSRDSYTHQMMKEHLRCPECRDVFKEPVSIPCGHSFCTSCVLSYWTKSAETSCPLCMKTFATPPALNLNVTLANVVQTHQQAAFIPSVPAQSYAGPGDVACDICTEAKIRAVKTCRTCGVSYCETHVRQHYTIERLQKHLLMEPVKDQEQGGVNTLGKTQVTVSKDLMSNLMNQVTRLQNQMTSIAVKLEVDSTVHESGTEHEPPRKRLRSQDEEISMIQLGDFIVPDNPLPRQTSLEW